MALQRWLPVPAEGAPRTALVSIATAASYTLVGWIALVLAGPPGYASPLFPSAGIALAAVLVWGLSAVPGVWLGSFAVNIGLGLARGADGAALVLLPAAIAVGAALQAAIGAALIHARIRGPVVLNSPADIAAAGVLGAMLACAVSPSVATPALLVTGVITPDAAVSNWVTWWLGDTLGVLIAAPLVLTLIGRPQEDWRPRRLTLGLPMLIALVLVAAALSELNRIDRERVRIAFERDADQAAARVQARLRTPLYALQATLGAVRAAAGEDLARTVRAGAPWWLAQEMPLQSISFFVRVPLADLAAFEAAAREQGLEGFRVFDRDDGSRRTADGEVVAMRVIEPAAGNQAALGVNSLSVPGPRGAVLATRASGEPAATPGFRLTQDSDGHSTGLAIYQAVFEGDPRDAAARQRAFRGAVSVAFRAEALLQPGTNGVPMLPSHLSACLLDADPAVERRVLAGPPGCDATPAGGARSSLLQTTRVLTLADRPLELRLSSEESALSARPRESALLLSLTGLSAAAMLGALLLIVTGQSRRTELAVQSATTTLRREIDDRGQAEDALRESEQRLRSILDGVPLGIVFLDPDGTLLDANPPMVRMIGRPLEQVRGRRLDEVVRPGDRAAVGEVLDAFIADFVSRRDGLSTAAPPDESPNLRRVLQLHHGPDGLDETWLAVSAVALHDLRGRPNAIVAVVEDISERHRLEASEGARQRAEASDRAKSEFVSRMSHELRTPLNAMIGFAQLLGLDREPALVPHQREWVQQIQRAGWHLLEMINDTLDLARIESGALRLNLEPVALGPAIAAAQAMVSAAAGDRAVAIGSAADTAATGGLAVLADPTRLRQILTNLLSNAVKYNRRDGRVEVGVRTTDDGLREIVVSDTGLGMTDAQLQGLFQPYNRLGRESGPIEGTGIGLVISQRLAELMGGSLTARSAPGVGSTFTLRLPAAAGVVEEPAATEPGALPPYRRRSVHYIEDNATNVEVMRGVLLQRPQVELTVSTSGLDGVQEVRRLRPDLVLLDMGLPDISGLELLRHLKQDDDVAGIPVIVVSADATTSRVQEALTLGALHYVTKPLDIRRFLALIDQALEDIETRWGM